MAAVPKTLTEVGRRDSSGSQKRAALSHGRGGAGNMGAPSPSIAPVDLETPTLKSHMYTTGRGGSGNMAKNDNAEEARRAQDVIGQVRRDSNNTTHVGRGGAANIFKASPAEIEAAKKDGKWESAVGDDKSEDGREGLVHAGAAKDKNEREKSKGLADKGKDWLKGRLGK